jgi:hypothetical protein
MTLTRRSALATTLMALIDAAQAQAPAPLKMVVPFGAGTTTDIVSRHVGEAIAAALGQPLVVDNKPGAGGTLGSDGVAKAPADGRTLLMGTVGTHAINPTLYRRLPYDALKDFVPIGLAGFTPTLLVVAANSPLKTVADLAAEAAKPAGVTFASAGNGTSGHLAGELLAARLGGRMVHVPYNQGGQALTDQGPGPACAGLRVRRRGAQPRGLRIAARRAVERIVSEVRFLGGLRSSTPGRGRVIREPADGEHRRAPRAAGRRSRSPAQAGPGPRATSHSPSAPSSSVSSGMGCSVKVMRRDPRATVRLCGSAPARRRRLSRATQAITSGGVTVSAPPKCRPAAARQRRLPDAAAVAFAHHHGGVAEGVQRVARLALRARGLQVGGDARQHLARLDGLGDVVGAAGGKRRHHMLGLGQAGHEDDGDGGGGLVGLQPARHLEAVHARHHRVQQHDVGRARGAPAAAPLRRRWPPARCSRPRPARRSAARCSRARRRPPAPRRHRHCGTGRASGSGQVGFNGVRRGGVHPGLSSAGRSWRRSGTGAPAGSAAAPRRRHGGVGGFDGVQLLADATHMCPGDSACCSASSRGAGGSRSSGRGGRGQGPPRLSSGDPLQRQPAAQPVQQFGQAHRLDDEVLGRQAHRVVQLAVEGIGRHHGGGQREAGSRRRRSVSQPSMPGMARSMKSASGGTLPGAVSRASASSPDAAVCTSKPSGRSTSSSSRRSASSLSTTRMRRRAPS